MQVFKFGGASVNSVERVQHLAEIVQVYQGNQLVVVVSAMGKTTNALEKVAAAFFNNRKEEALQLFEQVKLHHITTAKYLLITHFNEALDQLSDLFTEVEWALHDKPVRDFDYYYDQIVCSGELFSTTIISAYLNEKGITNTWLDIRDILRTDNRFRDAGVDLDITRENTKNLLLPHLQNGGMVVTQGFIGCTDENESTTLGREGSDYTAALLASLTRAESVTIWKDVTGVMSADPKVFQSATLLPYLSYDEVIEMAYYGAQVIHPKTIKPLQNAGIPLYVKCFLDPELPGTTIYKKGDQQLPPIIIEKKHQALFHLHTRDFSFIQEKDVATMFNLLRTYKEPANMVQTGAVAFMICTDDKEEKVGQLAAAAAGFFDVQVERDLTLLTIRHYDSETFESLTDGKIIVLRQQSPVTVRVLMK